MIRIKIVFLFVMVVFMAACKKELDVKNPNQPTPESASTEEGIIALSQGGVYVNGFRDLKYGDGVFGLFWSGAMGFHELMADVIQAEAANAYLNQVGVPDKVILSNGTEIINPNAPAKQKDMLRAINLNANQGQNVTYYEWAYMYNMISACNSILEQVDQVSFTGDAVSKNNTLKAWAYWWKGFAYSRIGSIYYAGIINDKSNNTNNTYVTKEQIITEATANLDKAVTAIA
ncbi:MAG TPA: hypothetical protein VM187_17685, partial [Niastella sp.]|nr:hypothetical protein [Niastella sp.]